MDRTTWQYYVTARYVGQGEDILDGSLYDYLEGELNSFGCEGWELVSIIVGRDHSQERVAQFFFKRPKE